jgi:hypothetical protein
MKPLMKTRLTRVPTGQLMAWVEGGWQGLQMSLLPHLQDVRFEGDPDVTSQPLLLLPHWLAVCSLPLPLSSHHSNPAQPPPLLQWLLRRVLRPP